MAIHGAPYSLKKHKFSAPQLGSFLFCRLWYTVHRDPLKGRKAMAAEPKKTARRRLTPVSTLHYVRLVYRSVLFLLLALQYILFRMDRQVSLTALMEQRPLLLTVVWAVFVVEMILRFFPSPLESPGCQKQFAQNYIKSGSTDIHIEDNNATLLVVLVWVMFNGVFGALHMAGILDDGIMILLCVAYSVCDMICILFFCPFQSWFMKNKCCSTCRIYNWDYAMMFTPLFFVQKTRLPPLPELHGKALHPQEAAVQPLEAHRGIHRGKDKVFKKMILPAQKKAGSACFLLFVSLCYSA